MFGSMVLEVAVGVIFVYLLLSLMVTAITELISGWLKWRATDLRKGIRSLLESGDSEKWVNALYEHSFIQGLSPTEEKEAKGKGPSYIPSRTFTLALLDVVRDTNSAGELLARVLRQALDTAPDSASLADLKKGIKDELQKIPDDKVGAGLKGQAAALVDRIPASVSLADAKKDLGAYLQQLSGRSLQSLLQDLPDTKLRKSLLCLLEESQGNIESFKENVEIWFNNSMSRVSGWYKRRTQLVHIILAVVLTLVTNVDTVLVVNALSKNPALRESVAAQAEAYAKENQPAASESTPAAAEATPAPVEATPAPVEATPAPAETPAPEDNAEPTPAPPAGTTEAEGAGQGGETAAATTSADPDETFRKLRAQLDALELPVGWVLPKENQKPAEAERDNADFREWPGWWPSGTAGEWALLWAQTVRFHLFGWVLTAFAISLGAPFWFEHAEQGHQHPVCRQGSRREAESAQGGAAAAGAGSDAHAGGRAGQRGAAVIWGSLGLETPGWSAPPMRGGWWSRPVGRWFPAWGFNPRRWSPIPRS